LLSSNEIQLRGCLSPRADWARFVDDPVDAELLGCQDREQADGAVTDDRDSFAGAGLGRDRTEPAGAEEVRGGEQAGDQVGVGHARGGDQGADPSADSDS
jgi:hypothetical protein